MKKLLVICTALDLELPYGLTPAVWQMLKALYELECEVIVVPYRGKAIRSLWWRCFDNPCWLEGEIYNKFQKLFGSLKKDTAAEGVTPKLARMLTLPKWKKHVESIFQKELDIDGVLFIQIPLNQIKGLAKFIHSHYYDVPCLYWESDVPTSLPEYGGFSFNHFLGSDLSEFDAFIIPSEGSKQRLLDMGANKVFIMHFGVDPEVYRPISTSKSIDVFFSGNGSRNREKAIKELLVKPSERMDANFIVSGRGYDMDLKNVQNIPSVPFNSWRNYCCASKINLNIARENHALTYATSTSRPFELSAMKCCVVSSEYLGLEKWFDIGTEILVVNDAEEAIDVYEWLLSDEEERDKLANNAYERVLRDHTFRSRAIDLLKNFEAISSST